MTLMATRPASHPGASPRLDLGPEHGDHLSLRVLSRLHPRAVGEQAGWLVCPAHVHVGGFSGDVAVALHVDELHRFAGALRALRAGVRHSAVLESAEEWIDLTVTRRDDALTVAGHLADEPGTGSRLRFRLTGIDPVALGGWIDACEDAVATYAFPASA